MVTPVALAGYVALFFGLGAVFLFVNLLVGSRVRPNLPNKEKLEIYECGEPTIGSSFVQFDLRFYVIALLFIIFDVEVAFFFPWATVYGKTANLSDPALPVVMQTANGLQYTPAAVGLQEELGLTVGAIGGTSVEAASNSLRGAAQQVTLLSFCDILAFFAILMVGFFYVWKRGDLDWVRSVAGQRARPATEVRVGRRGSARSILDQEPALSP
ncbi:MAG: NADH-quinone oxidoreductase subunit A [Pirellulales bacterium]